MRAALFFLQAFAAAAVCAAPAARCAAPEHDFGEAAAGAPLTHVFRVTNAGDSNLTLRVAVTCCGSKASVSHASLPPGEAAEISVEIALPAQPGPVRRAVYLATNDPSSPYLRLCLSGRVPGAGQAAAAGRGGAAQPSGGGDEEGTEQK